MAPHVGDGVAHLARLRRRVLGSQCRARARRSARAATSLTDVAWPVPTLKTVRHGGVGASSTARLAATMSSTWMKSRALLAVAEDHRRLARASRRLDEDGDDADVRRERLVRARRC